jgi:hypothetical protein
MNIIAPLLTLLCLMSYFAMVIFYFDLLSVIIPIALLVMTGSAIFLSLKIASPAAEITLKNSKNNSRFQMIGSIIDLISMELILLFSLFSLFLLGPKYKWEKIECTRRA